MSRLVSGIRPEQRAAVMERSQGCCERCGASVMNVEASVHHRLPRGRGGDDRLSGLVVICGSGVSRCHGHIESYRATAYKDGWLVRTGANPEAVPALTRAGWRHFLDDGRVLRVQEYLDWLEDAARVRLAVHESIPEEPS